MCLTRAQALQAAFRETTSPFYLAPGTTGPASPDIEESKHSEDVRAAAMREGREVLTRRGFDPDSFWEQPVVWGEQDSFQYVL
jgi:hypothetical protein